MAFVLVQLKIAIQSRHRGGSAVAHSVGLWGRWLVALVLGLGAGTAIALLDAETRGGNVLVPLILTGFWLGWIVLPMAIPGMGDTSVDPVRLEMFSISPWEQVAGFALGGFVAPTALFTFLTAAGGAFAPDEGLVARLLAVVVAVGYTLACIVASRSVMASTASAASSRRGRDIVFVAAGVVLLGAFLLINAAQGLLVNLTELQNSTLEAVLAWTPSGTFGSALLSLSSGDYGRAMLGVGYGLLWVALFAVLWTWAIKRRVKSGGRAVEARRRHRSEAEIALLPAPIAGVRPTPAVAAFAQQSRYFFFRSPKATQQIVAGIVGGAFIGYSMSQERGIAFGTAVFVPVMALALGLSTFNYDDRGFAYLLQTGVRLRGVLVGKVLLNWLITVAVMLVFIVVEAAITGSWSDVPAAIATGLGITTMATGVGALVGVTTPNNQERPGGGRGKLAVGLLGGLVAVGALMAAFVLVFDLFGDGELGLGTSLFALGSGLAAGAVFLWLAVRRAEGHPMEIAEALRV